MAKKTNAEKEGRINVTDPALRHTLQEITQMDRTANSITQAIRNAADHYHGYIRVMSTPIDYANEPIEVLRDYAIHGYDFTIRAPALAEIERRYKAAIVTEKEAQS